MKEQQSKHYDCPDSPHTATHPAFGAQTHTHARVFANGLVAFELPPRLTEAGGNIAGARRWDGLATGPTSAGVVCESRRRGGRIRERAWTRLAFVIALEQLKYRLSSKLVTYSR